MKRLLLLLTAFLLGMTLKSQETESSLLKVTSFEQLQSSMWKDNDLPEGMPKEDNNGKKWALIKISSKGVDADKFETIKIIPGDMQTAIGYQGISNGEVRVYVSSLKGAIRIKSYYGNLKYEFPYALQANKTYSMILELETATLTIRATPPEANIYIDGELAGTGSCSKVVSVGEEHRYKVTCDSYFDKTEVITLSKDGRNKEIDVALIANFGYIIVNSTPESGADVSIDGKTVGTTPITNVRIDRGKHVVVISKEMYQPVTELVNIVDDNPIKLNVAMTANFAELTVTTENGDEGTDIYIDNVLKGKGFWKGRISPGNYIIEARKAGCEKTKKTVSLSNGENSVITLDNPIPNYGNIEIESNPSGATIRLNNIQKGVTPDTITNLPVGEYSLVLTKEGYGSAIQTVTVHKDRTEYVNLILENGKSVTISSEPSGAAVYVDGTYAGLTPINISMSFGSHNVKVSLDGEEKTQTINVSESGNSSWSFDVRKKPTGREISINSEPGEDSVYVDSTYVGVTPIYISLSFGSHNVKVTNDGEEKTQTINVSEYGNSSWSFDVKKPISTYTVNGVSFEMVAVEGGTFTMGCTNEQGSDCFDFEKPSHRVTLNDYMIGKYEVTQELWQAVMGNNPSSIKGSNNPVEKVSWNDCQEFIKKLNQLTGQNFRLPTEAEWEFAARGGNKSKGYKYSGGNTLGNVAWFTDNSRRKTHPVGTKSPNELGIYDMSGNVWEWCQDWYGSYSSDSETNSKGPSSGSYRVRRGGSWDHYAKGCRVSFRNYRTPAGRGNLLGFRLASQ